MSTAGILMNDELGKRTLHRDPDQRFIRSLPSLNIMGISLSNN